MLQPFPTTFWSAGGVPDAPTGLAAVAGDGGATLTWDSVGGVTWNVYRGTSSGGESGTPVAAGLTSATYADTGLSNGTAYYYVVRAVGAGGASAASNEAVATPWSPISLGSLLVAWWAADRGRYTTAAGSTAAVADGDPIGRWEDQSGSALHGTQAAAGSRPVVRLVSGVPWVEADGTNDGLDLPSFGFSGATQHAVFAGVRLTRAPAAYDTLFTSTLGTGSPAWMMSKLSGTDWGTYFSGDTPAGVALANGGTYVLGMNGGQFRTNGVNGGTYSGSVAAGGAALFYQPGVGRYAGGRVRDIVACNAPLAGADLASLEAYLAGRVGVSL